MQVSSYIFQSPYSQPVQIGQPDPTSVKKEEKPQVSPIVNDAAKTTAPQEGKISSLVGSSVSIPLSTLQSTNTQSSVSEFKSLSSVTQAQKVYTQG